MKHWWIKLALWCALRTILAMCSLKHKCESTTTPRSRTFSDTVKRSLPRQQGYPSSTAVDLPTSITFVSYRISEYHFKFITYSYSFSSFSSLRRSNARKLLWLSAVLFRERNVHTFVPVNKHSLCGRFVPGNESAWERNDHNPVVHLTTANIVIWPRWLTVRLPTSRDYVVLLYVRSISFVKILSLILLS